MPRLLHLSLSTFYFLLFTLFALTPTSLHAESALYIKRDDNQVRATERLHDFLGDIGYSVEYRDEDKDSLIIQQQQQKAHAILKTGDNTELCTVTIAVHYEFNRNAAAANERALAANAINNAQYNMKVCVDEEVGDFYFEYTLPFDRYMRPRTFKSFADQAIARSYLMIMHHKELKRAFFGEGNDDAPDSARNADEADQDSDDEPAMTDEEAMQEATAPTPSPSEPPSSAPTVPPSALPEPPSREAAEPPSPQSLIPELPPTTPASPAPSKKARA